MLSLRAIPASRATRSVCSRCLKLDSPRSLSTKTFNSRTPRQTAFPTKTSQYSFSKSRLSRAYATKSSADNLIEDIQDQYATARDEFEIASEETEKKSVYAADDRAAAREELDKLKEMFGEALQGTDAEEIKGRIGQRIRELDNAVEALEKSAQGD